jgi:phosphoribosylformimino-5-aminoimidazole carboxamide ribotide isomerase
MLVIPAIDIRGGKCVRLAQGDFGRETVYEDDPVRVAVEFDQDGAEWVHIVDLDGAKSGVLANLEIVQEIIRETSLKVEFGGGVRSLDIAKEVLGRGAHRVVIGSKLAQDPEMSQLMFCRFGEQVVAGIDARSGKVALEGWIQEGEVSANDLALAAERLGARRVILTDISRDGMLTGPNIELLREVSGSISIPIIQSGGIGTLEDFQSLKDLGEQAPEGVIVGRALYEGRFSLREALDACAI